MPQNGDLSTTHFEPADSFYPEPHPHEPVRITVLVRFRVHSASCIGSHKLVATCVAKNNATCVPNNATCEETRLASRTCGRALVGHRIRCTDIQQYRVVTKPAFTAIDALSEWAAECLLLQCAWSSGRHLPTLRQCNAQALLHAPVSRRTQL